MRKRYVLLLVAWIVVSCGAVGTSQEASGSPERHQLPNVFRLCNANPNNNFSIGVRYGEWMGNIEDVATNIAACGDANSGCIKYPFVISVPPRLPRGTHDQVRWSVEDWQFSIRQVPDPPNTYTIRAEPLHASRESRRGTVIQYDRRLGVMRLEQESLRETWVRCEGRMTFDDLRELRRRCVPIEMPDGTRPCRPRRPQSQR
jgi:hypothetical protein